MSPSLWTLWWWTSSASVGNLDSAVTKYWGNYIDDDDDNYDDDEYAYSKGDVLSHERPPGPAGSGSDRLGPQTWYHIVIIIIVIVMVIIQMVIIMMLVLMKLFTWGIWIAGQDCFLTPWTYKNINIFLCALTYIWWIQIHIVKLKHICMKTNGQKSQKVENEEK